MAEKHFVEVEIGIEDCEVILIEMYKDDFDEVFKLYENSDYLSVLTFKMIDGSIIGVNRNKVLYLGCRFIDTQEQGIDAYVV